METQVRTPQMVFMQPQRLVVPLFQRPYVWNQENQWEPLWSDVARVADRLLSRPIDKHHPHFLGAVVLQQIQRQTGQMQERTIIDGQQRLTTLQLLLDALHAELQYVQAVQPAMRIQPLVENAEAFRAKPEDRFKVWPTNRDRAAFNEVMSADPPINYASIQHKNERMVHAHRYFSEQARKWLTNDGSDQLHKRSEAIETAVRELLQMVVIDLGVDENAQEIFETLNARGAQLTPADLIKNFIFQRLADTNVEEAYQRYWKDFETGFWETEISVGRLRYPRSSIFLNHWLIARTGEEVVAREVFTRFKRFADSDNTSPMADLVKRVHDAARVYRVFIESASRNTGPVDRLALFGYRTGVLESEVIKPLVLSLLDPEQQRVPDAQLTKALDVLESWMVRRMLVRATTKNYNQVVAEIVTLLRKNDRANTGDVIEQFLSSQTSESRYWPDDAEVTRELLELPAYRRLSRGRLRMVLEAIEDHLRGWRNGRQGLGGERVARASLAIEHVMPRKWLAHWPLPAGHDEGGRDRLIHTLGNLTLLTGRLNSKVSNGPWLGTDGKRQALQHHDVLVVNRELLQKGVTDWSDDAIQVRTKELISVILQVWPVPPGYRSKLAPETTRLRKRVSLADLIAAGVLHAGMSLFPRRKKYGAHVATLLGDGRVEVDDVAYTSASEAASNIAGHNRNGWGFFAIDQASGRSLRAIRRDYVDALSVDIEDDEVDEAEEDEEAAETT